MKAKKVLKTVGIVLLCLIVVSAYPVYAVVVWNLSKSPDDIEEFPKTGIWVCEGENFVMTIDLQNVEENESPVKNMQVMIEYKGKRQNLNSDLGHGHGTPIAPTAPADILYFESADLESADPDYISFSTSKYRFGENDFYLLDISVSRKDNARIIEPKTDLHFTRQSLT